MSIKKFLQRLSRSVLFETGYEMRMYPTRKEGDIILVYHNVLPHSIPGLNLRNMGVRDFTRDLEYLQRRYEIVSLSEMIAEPAGSRRVAITFDDGLLNNLRYALPVLEELNIPATFFICTPGLIGRPILWPDHISMTGLQTGKDLEYDGRAFRKNSENRYLDSSGNSLTEELRQQPWSVIEPFLRRSEQLTGYCPGDDHRHEYRWKVMREDDIRILAESPLVEIGSHCVSHTNLSILSDDEVMFELSGSKSFLERASGVKVESLAFPFGKCDARLIELAYAAGYKRQFAGHIRNNMAGVDHQIRKRIGMYNDRSNIERMHLVNRRFHA